MAVSTAVFTLTTGAYQDISEGAASCAFRVPLRGHRDNAVRVILGTSLPSAGATNYDLFTAPEKNEEERVVQFAEFGAADRVYVRLDAEPVKAPVLLAVYRK